jgi:hypothetical protein
MSFREKEREKSQAGEERKIVEIGTHSKNGYNTEIKAKGIAYKEAVQYRF